MKTVLYYSTTGLALQSAKLFSPDYLIDVCRGEEIPKDTDVLGFVFSTPNSGLPYPMKKAVEKLKLRDNSKLGYIFSIAVLSDRESFNGRIVEKEIEDSGLNLSYFNSVKLPQEEEKLKKIVEETNDEKILLPSASFTYRLQKKITERLNKPTLPEDLNVSNNCNGCAICARLCPMANITIERSRANIHNMCIQCLSCFSFCPQNAITSKREKKTIAEGIKLEELFKRL